MTGYSAASREPDSTASSGVPVRSPDGSLHEARGDRRRLLLALGIALLTAAAEVWGGVLTGSLALLSDSVHVLADASALGLALAAVQVSMRPHTLRWTFGYHRAEVLAAFVNALVLLLIIAILGWQACSRLRTGPEVDAGGLLVVAALGLGANVLALVVLGHASTLNLRAARLHVLSDLGGSVAAVLAGVLVGVTGWTRFDPLLSLVILALVLLAALRLLREAVPVLMDRAPSGIDLAEVEAALHDIEGVQGVHDTHLWTITSGFDAFACHLDVGPGVDPAGVVAQAATLLRERFGIAHVTIQPDVRRLHHPGVVT